MRDRITLLGKSFSCIKSMWLLYCRFQFFEFEPFVSYWKIYIAREQNTRTANNFIHYNICQNISNAVIHSNRSMKYSMTNIITKKLETDFNKYYNNIRKPFYRTYWLLMTAYHAFDVAKVCSYANRKLVDIFLLLSNSKCSSIG